MFGTGTVIYVEQKGFITPYTTPQKPKTPVSCTVIVDNESETLFVIFTPSQCRLFGEGKRNEVDNCIMLRAIAFCAGW